MGLSRERFGWLLGVSAKTIERWEERAALPTSSLVRQRLAQLKEVADIGRIVYTAEGLTQFLTLPFPRFGGRTALQLIELGQGELVIGALAADYEGLGY
jgi:hypothetical protein